MRSLEEWTRYLERQEQALKKKAAPAEEAESKHASAERTEGEKQRSSETKKPAPDETPSSTAQVSSKPQAKTITVGLRKRARQVSGLNNAQAKQEVAQNSYRPFKETREELLERLLDPVLTLEETARILNVCPTTVRRYTNRNLLKHYRTAGNQRRFRLSDVLEFLETQGGLPKE